MRRGLPAHAFDGRPHIAIANTASDLTPCNAHFNEAAESVKQGVYEAGGIPLNLPVISLGETLVRPKAMLWRNMARMSGTAYGTVVLHVSPEAAAGGPLDKVRTGDFIILDVANRRLDIDIPAAELELRLPSDAAAAGYANPKRGWEKLYSNTVLGANSGADLDFLLGLGGDRVSRESH